MNKQHQIKRITLISIFTALIFVSTGIGVNGPAGGRIHLGNFTAILSALLFGPIAGAISGSLGMGLFNIHEGRSPETTIRTFIINFFLGLIVGLVFKYLLKAKTKKLTDNRIQKIALISATIGMITNLILEFIFRVILGMIFNNIQLIPAIISSATIVATMSTARAVVTILLVPKVYKYLFIALSDYDILKPELTQEDNDEVSI